jgi:hypothetical protein
MELKKALEIQVQHFGRDGSIRVDENGYICLNDLNEYFPNKRLDNWLRLDSSKELIEAVTATLNTSEVRELESSVLAKRGRHKSGTYAHEVVAMDFAAWLSVEFRIALYRSYIDGTQRKNDWNIKRILAANNYKLMCEAIKDAHEPAKGYHYSNEARMLNVIVFGVSEPGIRDGATEAQLDALAWLEGRNGAMIDLGMEYDTRKEKLYLMYVEKYIPRHVDIKAINAVAS